jgi:hypothetical protein
MYRDIEKGYNLGYIWVGREKEIGTETAQGEPSLLMAGLTGTCSLSG